ncbi:hypothetical protein GAMM_60247 [Gammaproteobacteria bacterium]
MNQKCGLARGFVYCTVEINFPTKEAIIELPRDPGSAQYPTTFDELSVSCQINDVISGRLEHLQQIILHESESLTSFHNPFLPLA